MYFTKKQLEERLGELFSHYDEDNAGKLDRKKYDQLLQELVIEFGGDISSAESDKLFQLLDENHTGFIEREEFLTWKEGRSFVEHFLIRQLCEQLWEKYTDAVSFISLKEFEQFAKDLCATMGEESDSVQEYVRDAFKGGQALKWEEFLTWWEKRNIYSLLESRNPEFMKMSPLVAEIQDV